MALSGYRCRVTCDSDSPEPRRIILFTNPGEYMSRPKNQELIDEIRRVAAQNALHWTTFLPIPQEAKAETEQILKDNFRRWWTTWMEPLVDEIETRLVKKPKVKSDG